MSVFVDCLQFAKIRKWNDAMNNPLKTIKYYNCMNKYKEFYKNKSITRSGWISYYFGFIVKENSGTNCRIRFGFGDS